jgi:hypothetical protein
MKRDSILENVKNSFKNNEKTAKRNRTRAHIRTVAKLASDADFKNRNIQATKDREKKKDI